MTIRTLLRAAAAAALAVPAVLIAGTGTASAIYGGGCSSGTVVNNWVLRPCINHHDMVVGYDGYVTPGKPLQACLLRLFVFDDNTGDLAAPYLDYSCNRTYLPGGGFVATKGHCYDTEMVLDSTVAEWYWWTSHSVCA